MIESTTKVDIFPHGRTMSMDQPMQQKRFRSGSISGRLRTASDLEESGWIDKSQKGILKDLIISGDDQLRQALDKYEGGEKAELLDLIQKKGIFQRKNSIDILDNLDFTFLNVVTNTKRDRFNSLDDQMSFAHAFDDNINHDSEFAYLDVIRPNRTGSLTDGIFPSNVFTEDFETERLGNRRRNSSMDSTNSLKIFDYLNQIGFDDVEKSHDISTAYPFGSQNPIQTGNRVVQAFSRRNDNHVDMSAYTAVARSLQSNPTIKPVAASTQRLKPSTTATSSTITTRDSNMITTKEKPVATMNPQFNLSTLPGASTGIPTSTKHSDNPDNKGVVGAYSTEQRRKRIDKFLEKRSRRVWTKKVKYDVRKNFADSRLRVKGRFVKKEEEHIMRELLDI